MTFLKKQECQIQILNLKTDKNKRKQVKTMNFKDILENDIQNVFLNSEEFGEHII